MGEKYSVIKSRYIWLIAGMILLLPLAGMIFYTFSYRSRIGPEQPVHFSHRLHVNEKGISCLVCHEGAVDTKQAGIPPLQTCMLCHDRIITGHPEIVNLRDHYISRKPVIWNKVQEKLPDHVFFNHSVHVHKNIDCGVCHGNVREMDRVEQANQFTMGFCVKCHQEKKASIDCYTCHR